MNQTRYYVITGNRLDIYDWTGMTFHMPLDNWLLMLEIITIEQKEDN
jgi:hypothetical protein